MNKKLSDAELWEIIGFVKASKPRYMTLATLETKFMTPSEIAKINNTRTTQISAALHDLKEKELVECLNENIRKGRLYKNTELGLTILKILKQ